MDRFWCVTTLWWPSHIVFLSSSGSLDDYSMLLLSPLNLNTSSSLSAMTSFSDSLRTQKQPEDKSHKRVTTVHDGVPMLSQSFPPLFTLSCPCSHLSLFSPLCPFPHSLSSMQERLQQVHLLPYIMTLSWPELSIRSTSHPLSTPPLLHTSLKLRKLLKCYSVYDLSWSL